MKTYEDDVTLDDHLRVRGSFQILTTLVNVAEDASFVRVQCSDESSRVHGLSCSSRYVAVAEYARTESLISASSILHISCISAFLSNSSYLGGALGSIVSFLTPMSFIRVAYEEGWVPLTSNSFDLPYH